MGGVGGERGLSGGRAAGGDDRAVSVGGRAVRVSARRGALAVGAAGAAFAYLAARSSWEDVSEVLGSVSPAGILVVAALGAANLVTYWLVMAAGMPGLRVRDAAVAHLPANACSNLLPAGGAIGSALCASVLRRHGYSGSSAAVMLVVTGIWNNAAKLAVPAFAVLAMLVTDDVDPADAATAALAAAALVAGVVIVMKVLRRDDVAVRAGRWAEGVVSTVRRRFGRPAVSGWDAAGARLHRHTAEVVRDRWAHLTAAAAVSHLTLLALFVVSVRAAGIASDTISGVELLDPAEAIGAVVLFRAATYAAPTIVGACTLAAWGLSRRRHRDRDHLTVDRVVPLVVDLDGTLLPVTTRTLMLARLLWIHPSLAVTYLRLHRRDRLGSKRYLLEHAGIDLERVPVRRSLLRWLEDEHFHGRPLYLASGTPAEVVQALAKRVKLFEGAWGSSASIHLVGDAKAVALEHEFGRHGFDYVGDAYEDLPVWTTARHAVVFAPSRRLLRRARAEANVTGVLSLRIREVMITPFRVARAVVGQRPGDRSLSLQHLEGTP